jgi:hypothetical protein
MLCYGLAGMAGVAGGLLPALVLGNPGFMHDTNNGGSSNIQTGANEHVVLMYENNIFKEKIPSSELPEGMRYRKQTTTTDDGKTITRMVPVGKIEVLFIGIDGKLTTSDKAVEVEIHEYAIDGTWLYNTIMVNRRYRDSLK